MSEQKSVEFQGPLMNNSSKLEFSMQPHLYRPKSKERLAVYQPTTPALEQRPRYASTQKFADSQKSILKNSFSRTETTTKKGQNQSDNMLQSKMFISYGSNSQTPVKQRPSTAIAASSSNNNGFRQQQQQKRQLRSNKSVNGINKSHTEASRSPPKNSNNLRDSKISSSFVHQLATDTSAITENTEKHYYNNKKSNNQRVQSLTPEKKIIYKGAPNTTNPVLPKAPPERGSSYYRRKATDNQFLIPNYQRPKSSQQHANKRRQYKSENAIKKLFQTSSNNGNNNSHNNSNNVNSSQIKEITSPQFNQDVIEDKIKMNDKDNKQVNQSMHITPTPYKTPEKDQGSQKKLQKESSQNQLFEDDDELLHTYSNEDSFIKPLGKRHMTESNLHGSSSKEQLHSSSKKNFENNRKDPISSLQNIYIKNRNGSRTNESNPLKSYYRNLQYLSKNNSKAYEVQPNTAADEYDSNIFPDKVENSITQESMTIKLEEKGVVIPKLNLKRLSVDVIPRQNTHYKSNQQYFNVAHFNKMGAPYKQSTKVGIKVPNQNKSFSSYTNDVLNSSLNAGKPQKYYQDQISKKNPYKNILSDPKLYQVQQELKKHSTEKQNPNMKSHGYIDLSNYQEDLEEAQAKKIHDFKTSDPFDNGNVKQPKVDDFDLRFKGFKRESSCIVVATTSTENFEHTNFTQGDA